MKLSKRIPLFILASCLLAPLAASAAAIGANAGGTARIPTGTYRSPADIHAWLNAGHPLTAEMQAQHGFFGAPNYQQGGILGGVIETYPSVLVFTITGHGDLEGWSRTLVVPANCETHLAPRKEGEPIQSFDTNMYRIEGGIRGDRDFEYFQVTAGTGNGLDSPGHTTLFQQKDGSWLVESSFEIKYSIKFKGAAGGKFDGVEDSAEGSITMVAEPDDPKFEEIAKAGVAKTASK